MGVLVNVILATMLLVSKVLTVLDRLLTLLSKLSTGIAKHLPLFVFLFKCSRMLYLCILRTHPHKMILDRLRCMLKPCVRA